MPTLSLVDRLSGARLLLSRRLGGDGGSRFGGGYRGGGAGGGRRSRCLARRLGA